ncbi:MAG: glycoside hydrolase family 32 protein, partial [Erysipelotrichaceae bacterium]|nr:glycoside hydrolase family 32 protein [Erysipelotrichaceae bacterium]
MMHFHTPANWINDPNGFIFFNGRYHLFSQYFPYGRQWGTMHWWHAVSDDLVNWQHLGIALFPSCLADQNGAFSGSAIEKDGSMHIFYTGVQYQDVQPNNIHKSGEKGFLSAQISISSPDGMEFDNFGGKKVVISVI